MPLPPSSLAPADFWTDARFQSAVDRLAAIISRLLDRHGITFTTSPAAPDTWEKLRDAHGADPTTLVVWDGASDKAIWSAEANFRYRALHDYHHIIGGYSFTSEDEKKVSAKQANEIIRECFGSGGDVSPVVVFWAEAVGQVEHVDKHGTFPVDQKAFALAYLRNGCKLPAAPF